MSAFKAAPHQPRVHGNEEEKDEGKEKEEAKEEKEEEVEEEKEEGEGDDAHGEDDDDDDDADDDEDDHADDQADESWHLFKYQLELRWNRYERGVALDERGLGIDAILVTLLETATATVVIIWLIVAT